MFPDALTRTSTIPDFDGQQGYQQDTGTHWYSEDNVWYRTIPQYTDDYITIGIFGNAGSPGVTQTGLATRLALDGCEYIVPCGNNSYNGEANFAADHAAFNSWTAAEKAFWVLGNEDVSGANGYDLHTAAFTYLPGNRRYYSVLLGGGLVELFILHTGYDNVDVVIEPDGNIVGSAQHAWLIDAIQNSSARYKFIFRSRPHISSAEGATVAKSVLDWPVLAQADAVFSGYPRMTEEIGHRGAHLFNAGHVMFDDDETGIALQGSDVIAGNLLRTNSDTPIYIRLTVTPHAATIEWIEINSGFVVYATRAGHIAQTSGGWETMLAMPDEAVADDTYIAGRTTGGYVVNKWVISVTEAASEVVTGSVFVDGVEHAQWELTEGFVRTEAQPFFREVKKGSLVTVTADVGALYSPPNGLQVALTGALVQ